MIELIATHQGKIRLGNIEIDCAILEDGRRVIYRRAFLLALGCHQDAAGHRNRETAKLPDFLSAKNLRPFISNALETKLQPTYFRFPNGAQGVGYDADALPAVCAVYLRARRAGALRKSQSHIAYRAEDLIVMFATRGVRALAKDAVNPGGEP